MSASNCKVQTLDAFPAKEEVAKSEPIFLKEDIWGKDIKNYAREIVSYGNTLMVFGGLVAIFASPLSIFWDGKGVEAIQGIGFTILALGLSITLRPLVKASIFQEEK